MNCHRGTLPLALLAASLGAVICDSTTTLSDWNKGVLTFYGGAPDGMNPDSPSFGTKEGACGYGVLQKNSYPFFAAAALSPSNSFVKTGPVNACGQCFQVQCIDPRPGVCIKDSSGQPASVTAMISDSCPECEADHMDIQALSFAKVAVPSYGRVQMQYRRVSCNPPTDMQVELDNFGGPGAWMRLSIGDTGGRGAVQQVLVKGSSSGSWKPMSNKWGATWELPNAPQPPLDFKIFTDDGSSVVASNVVKNIGSISNQVMKFATGVQFTIGGGSSSGFSGKVQAFNGPSEDSPGGAPTSETPFSSGGGGSSPQQEPQVQQAQQALQEQCVDIPATGSFSCDQQKGWGKCSDQTFIQLNYCAKTCGRCQTTSSSPQAMTPSPAPSASSASPSSSSPAPSPSASSSSPPSSQGPSPAPASSPPRSSPAAYPSPVPASSPTPLEHNLGADGVCTDIPPDSSATCTQRKAWGQCNDSITTSRNFCAMTCGRCTPSGNNSSKGRKLLWGR